MPIEANAETLYPAGPLGGAVSLSFGGAMLAAVVADPQHLAIGTAAGGILAIFDLVLLRRYLLNGRRPSPKQRRVFILAVVSLTLCMSVASPLLAMLDPRTCWLGKLAITAVHLLAMRQCHGPLMGRLGATCLGIVAAGALLPDLPIAGIVAIDACAKIMFGSLLVFAGGLPGPVQVPATIMPSMRSVGESTP